MLANRRAKRDSGRDGGGRGISRAAEASEMNIRKRPHRGACGKFGMRPRALGREPAAPLFPLPLLLLLLLLCLYIDRTLVWASSY